MTSAAELEATAAGLAPASAGWFVMNARYAGWLDTPGQGHSLPLTGDDEYDTEASFRCSQWRSGS